jgi:hypothetical protein
MVVNTPLNYKVTVKVKIKKEKKRERKKGKSYNAYYFVDNSFICPSV